MAFQIKKWAPKCGGGQAPSKWHIASRIFKKKKQFKIPKNFFSKGPYLVGTDVLPQSLKKNPFLNADGKKPSLKYESLTLQKQMKRITKNNEGKMVPKWGNSKVGGLSNFVGNLFLKGNKCFFK